jgi:urease accessory protein
MTASTAFLTSLQLADSALPIGRFVHSYGLERWFQENPQADDDALRQLIHETLRDAVAPLDGVAVTHAARAVSCERLIEIDETLTAFKLTTASRQASTSCGRRLARLARSWPLAAAAAAYLNAVTRGSASGNLAVVEGAVAAGLGVGESEAVLLELRGAVTAMLAAAVRLGRLGPDRAQSMLFDLAPTIAAAAELAQRTPLAELRSTAPNLEICTMIHRLQDSRTFAS